MSAARTMAAGGQWLDLEPQAAAAWLRQFDAPWWIAGGWALDLYAGHTSRHHGDLDVGVLRRDATQALAAFRDWEVFEAQHGVLTQLAAGDLPRAEVNSLWCRAAHATCWTLELMLDDSVGDCWAYRRDRDLRRPLHAAVRYTAQGLPYLAPEIQLLYKSRNSRPRDDADFARTEPRLQPEARHWLRDALARCEPQHDWLCKLQRPA